ncbi:MAG: L-threonine 3-dehydrogenase [Chloroflexi bacterium]|nr:L-threonine 3-dehydrogenase [Chloroflexota bacterium]
MLAVVKAQAGPGFELRNVPIPTIGPHDVLIKTRACSICGTDLHIYNWDVWSQNRIKPPLIVGHEFSGEIVDIGRDVNGLSVGAFVSAESHIVCNMCDECRTGNAHVCRNTRIIGVDQDGCFAEYVAIPAQNVWVNPADMPCDIASLQENFGNAVHTALATPLVARDILVTGCGPAGLMTIAVARASGAHRIFASDLSDYRLDLARKLGAHATINVSQQNLVQYVREATHGEGVDVLLEMAGAPSSIRDGLAALKHAGTAVLLGLPRAPFELDLGNLVVMSGITVLGIAGRRLWQTWYQMRGLLSGGAVDLSPVITHHFKLTEYEKAFQVMASGQSGKVILTPDF